MNIIFFDSQSKTVMKGVNWYWEGIENGHNS
jgi:hypothetical protein